MKNRIDAPMKTDSGLTLVEVIVAMSILTTVLAGAVAVMIQTVWLTEQVRNRSTATSLAWSRVERIRNAEIDEVNLLIENAPGTRVSFTGAADEEGDFLRTTDIQDESAGLSMIRVRVEVWPWNRRNQEFSGEPQVVETVITAIPRN